eukprot:Rmarinus@m.27139
MDTRTTTVLPATENATTMVSNDQQLQSGTQSPTMRQSFARRLKQRLTKKLRVFKKKSRSTPTQDCPAGSSTPTNGTEPSSPEEAATNGTEPSSPEEAATNATQPSSPEETATNATQPSSPEEAAVVPEGPKPSVGIRRQWLTKAGVVVLFFLWIVSFVVSSCEGFGATSIAFLSGFFLLCSTCALSSICAYYFSFEPTVRSRRPCRAHVISADPMVRVPPASSRPTSTDHS